MHTLHCLLLTVNAKGLNGISEDLIWPVSKILLICCILFYFIIFHFAYLFIILFYLLIICYYCEGSACSMYYLKWRCEATQICAVAYQIELTV